MRSSFSRETLVDGAIERTVDAAMQRTVRIVRGSGYGADGPNSDAASQNLRRTRGRSPVTGPKCRRAGRTCGPCRRILTSQARCAGRAAQVSAPQYGPAGRRAGGSRRGARPEGAADDRAP